MDHIKADSVLWQLQAVQLWAPTSPVPLHVKLNLRFGVKPSTTEVIDWEACDAAILDYTQARCVAIELHELQIESGFEYSDHTWIPMDEDETQFLVNHLPSSYAAGKISFARPADGEWDLKTKEEKEQDRVVKTLTKMTKVKRDEVTTRVMEMAREETATKELFTKLIKIMEEDEMAEDELREILRPCEHQVWLDLSNLLS